MKQSYALLGIQAQIANEVIRSKSILIVALSLAAGVAGYVVFLYVIVHCIGAFMGLWPY